MTWELIHKNFIHIWTIFQDDIQIRGEYTIMKFESNAKSNLYLLYVYS